MKKEHKWRTFDSKILNTTCKPEEGNNRRRKKITKRKRENLQSGTFSHTRSSAVTMQLVL
jgi:hypothetical protein